MIRQLRTQWILLISGNKKSQFLLNLHFTPSQKRFQCFFVLSLNGKQLSIDFWEIQFPQKIRNIYLYSIAIYISIKSLYKTMQLELLS